MTCEIPYVLGLYLLRRLHHTPSSSSLLLDSLTGYVSASQTLLELTPDKTLKHGSSLQCLPALAECKPCQLPNIFGKIFPLSVPQFPSL